MGKPVIRFKRFEDEWEERKLGELYTERNERGNDSLQILSVSIHSGVSDGELDAENLGKIVRRSEDKSTYKHVYEGDLVFNMMRAWQGAIGVAKSEGMISPAYISAIPGVKLYPLFMNYLLRRKEIIGQINNLSYGVTDFRKRLYWDSFVKVVCNIPGVEEQEKIAEYFENLDRLITLHQRKCEETKILKKYMLQKMFPQNGQSVPEIRFSGFTEDWEQRKLGELAEIVGGGTPSTSVNSYWDGEIDWYAPAEIGEQIYLESSQRKITEEGLNKSSAKMLPVGTVLFTSRAGIGKTAILLKEGCTNQGFQSIVPNKEKLDSYFIFTRSEELKRYGETVGAGSTFVEVSGKQMANMELMIPTTMQEQQKIGAYFKQLDHLITLHQRKCEELKNIKKFMLQKMFPKEK